MAPGKTRHMAGFQDKSEEILGPTEEAGRELGDIRSLAKTSRQ